MSMARAANISVAQWNTNAETSDRKTKMEITTLVGGEVENMGIPHYSGPKGRAAKKRHCPHVKSFDLRSLKNKNW